MKACSCSFLLSIISFVALTPSFCGEKIKPQVWTYVLYSTMDEVSDFSPDTTYQLGDFLLKPIKKTYIQSELVVGGDAGMQQKNVSERVVRLELIDLKTDSVYHFSVENGETPVFTKANLYSPDENQGGFDVFQLRHAGAKIAANDYLIKFRPDTVPDQYIAELVNERERMDVFIDSSINTPFNTSITDNHGNTLAGALTKINTKTEEELVVFYFKCSYIPDIPEDKKQLIHQLREILGHLRLGMETDHELR